MRYIIVVEDLGTVSPPTLRLFVISLSHSFLERFRIIKIVFFALATRPFEAM